MVDTRTLIRFACHASEIESSPPLSLSLFVDHLRTVLAVKGCFAAPFGAPLTAPGRSEGPIPLKREREV
jgi:hypothetical protein